MLYKLTLTNEIRHALQVNLLPQRLVEKVFSNKQKNNNATFNVENTLSHPLLLSFKVVDFSP
jgi:hypothetical protein